MAVSSGKKGPWERAWQDFVRLDRNAELHGSRRIGVGCADSDVDVVSSVTLKQLVDMLRSNASASPAREFELLEHVSWARVPRVILKHKLTNIEVDVINCQLDHQSHERDEVVQVLLDACPLARDFVVRIGEWVHAHSALMPPKQGFPNTYTFRMVGFHLLQTRKPGPLLPALAPSGAVLRDIPMLETHEDVRQLFEDWLGLLVEATQLVQVGEGRQRHWMNRKYLKDAGRDFKPAYSRGKDGSAVSSGNLRSLCCASYRCLRGFTAYAHRTKAAPIEYSCQHTIFRFWRAADSDCCKRSVCLRRCGGCCILCRGHPGARSQRSAKEGKRGRSRRCLERGLLRKHLFKRLIFSWKLNGRFRDRAGGVGALEQLGIWPHLHEDDIQPQRCDILMFERFNEKAIKAVMTAQEESRRLGHNYVGTEMLLVGVVADTSGPSAKVLKKFNVTLKDTRRTVEETVGRGSGMVSVEIPFTPAAKRVLGDGVEEAKRLNANTIDTAHILLALLKEDNGNAVNILGKLGVDPSKMPEEIIKELQEKEERSLVGVTSRGGGSGKTVTLEEFGNDLTKAAEEGKMDPLVGRQAELERTIQILARRQKNNPVLIGEPGVGKTAIAEGLAQKIVAGDIPELLQGKRIVQLDLAMLLAGTRYRGEFEERLKNVIKEVLDSKKQIILMIDEIHTIVGAGGTGDGGGAIDAGNIMKPALSRGELQVIGATTIEEYRKYIEKDKALERRFQPVNVPEPTNEETLTILKGLAKKYEDHHKLKYTDEALAACVKFASQYIQDRFLPDKAIDVLDETGARVRLRESSILPEEAKEAQNKLKEVMTSKEEAVRNQNYELAQELKTEDSSLRTKIKSIISESKSALATDEDEEEAEGDEKARKEILVTEADVAAVVSKWTGVPVEKVSSDEGARLVKLEEVLHARVIGQNEAVTAVAKAVRRARAGLKNPNRPIASFIFCGPTGVGKTELCKALAAAYFGKEDAMIRLDMSEFMERHTVSKLIGSPPGYVGYDEESQLTDGIRRKPYSLVLFDEDGRLTDSKGRVVSFKNALIIMTSNVGAKAIEKGIQGGGGIGFSGLEDAEDAETSSYNRLKTLVFDELKNFFKPEFLNRLDEVIVFRSLTKPEVAQIAELEFKKTFSRTKERGIQLSMTEKFKQKVVDEGFNPTYGARPLRRAIMRLVEDELAESFLKEPTREGEHILMDVNADGNVMILRDQPAPEGAEEDKEMKVVETTAARAWPQKKRSAQDAHLSPEVAAAMVC
eukprot:s357_g4.t1